MRSANADARYHAIAFLKLFANDIDWQESEQKNLLLCLHNVLTQIRYENYAYANAKFKEQCIILIKDLYPVLSQANRKMFANRFLFDPIIRDLMFDKGEARLKCYFLDYHSAEEAINELLAMLQANTHNFVGVCETLSLFVDKDAAILKKCLINFQQRMQLQLPIHPSGKENLTRRVWLLHIYFYYLFDQQTIQTHCNKLCSLLKAPTDANYFSSLLEFTDLLLFNRLQNVAEGFYVDNSLSLTDIQHETADAIFDFIKQRCLKIATGHFPCFLPYLKNLPTPYVRQYIELSIELLSSPCKERSTYFQYDFFKVLIELWRPYVRDFPLNSLKQELQEQLKTCCLMTPSFIHQFALLGLIDHTMAKSWLAQVSLNSYHAGLSLDEPLLVQRQLSKDLQALLVDKMFDEVEQLNPQMPVASRMHFLIKFSYGISQLSLNASQTRKFVCHLLQLTPTDELPKNNQTYECLARHLHLLSKPERKSFADHFIDRLIAFNDIIYFKKTHLTNVLRDASPEKLMALIQHVLLTVFKSGILIPAKLKLGCRVILSLATFLDYDHRNELNVLLLDDTAYAGYSIYIKYGLCVLNRDQLAQDKLHNLATKLEELPLELITEINSYIPRRKLL